MQIKFVKISNSVLFILGLLFMKTTVILTSVLFLAVIVASIFYFRDLNQDRQSEQRPFTHIPQDAVFLVSFQNDETAANIFAGYDLFKAMLGDTHFGYLKYIHQNLLLNESFSPIAYDQEIVLSFHPEKTRIDYLMVLPTSENITTALLFDRIAAIDTSFALSWADSTQQLIRLQLPDVQLPLFVGQKKGVILASFAHDLTVRALDENGRKFTEQAIEQFRSEKRKNTPMTLYINHSRLTDLATTLMQAQPGDFIRLVTQTLGQSALQMNFNSNALMFSGNSTLDTSSNYLALYSQQQPVTQDLKNVIPANTATYISFGISDFPQLHQGVLSLLTDRGELNQMQEQHRLIRERSKVSIQDDLLPEWGDEFAVLELANRETLGIVKIKDSLAFTKAIERISTPYPERMHRLNHSNLLYYSFGDPLKSFARPYFLLLGDYFICANHISTLRNFERDYSQRKNLTNTPGYINFDRLQANKANVTVFIHNENAGNTIAQRLKSSFRSAFTDDDHFGYGRFYAWSFQLAGTSGGFFSSVYAKYTDNDAPGATPEWTFNLHGRLITQPSVFRHDDAGQFILAQASNHILYAVSPTGEQLWNAQLPGPVLGEIYQLSDNSIVLTTAERLYRFDTHGDPLPGFSLQLPHEASYGASVYEKNTDIGIFVPANDRIMVYDANGETLPGWNNKTLTGDIRYDIKNVTLQGIHYVVAATDAGRVYFFNGNGELMHMAEDMDGMGFDNPISLQTSPADVGESRVLTTDTTGRVKSFFFANNQKYKHVGDWSAGHYFNAINITGDTVPELVFADRGQLAVYDNNTNSLVYHYDFDQDIHQRPFFFPAASGKYKIGVATANQLLYVFNEDGTLPTGFPLEGRAPFYYGTLQANGSTYLLMGKGDNTLYAYRF